MPTFDGHRKVTSEDGSTDSSWESFVCGHCGERVAGAVVARHSFVEDNRTREVRWLACTGCSRGSVANDSWYDPGVRFGPRLVGLPGEVRKAYDEARDCMSVSAYTAAELICRKILMHVAVDKGAKEGKSFVHYVDHLAGDGYVTPPMEPWVDLIRRHGNEATHELPQPEKERAEGTVMFTAELLRLVYEMEYMTKKYTPDPEDGTE